MSILSDCAITAAIEAGRIRITPYRSEQLNPVSYDLTLGDGVAVYEDCVAVGGPLDGRDLISSSDVKLEYPRRFFTEGAATRARLGLPPAVSPHDLNDVLDVKVEPRVRRFTIGPEGWVCKPGVGYLMHTAERVWTDRYVVPVLDGKSSIGRLFVQIHVTAGFGDPGFDGQYTLEVVVTHPVRLYAGMRIGQMRFHTIEGEVGRTYDKTGHYVGALAEGPVPSQAWRQFEEKP